MQINITGHHLDITDSIRSSVHSRLGKLEQQFPDISSLQVILTLEKHSQSAEVITHYLGQDVTANSKADDLYQAIGDVTTKLIVLLKKQKEKVKAHANQKPQRVEEAATAVVADDEELDD